jgi:glutathione S-transferase
MQELKNKAYKQELKPLIKECLRWLAQKDIPYLVGNTLTVADIFFYSVLDAIYRELPVFFTEFPALEFYHAMISSRPAIRAFLNSRRM